jgi:hypothetical protein
MECRLRVLFVSLTASLASLPFFHFTLPAGALADAFNAGTTLRLANLWLAGCAGALTFLGWAGILNATSRGRVCARSGLCDQPLLSLLSSQRNLRDLETMYYQDLFCSALEIFTSEQFPE